MLISVKTYPTLSEKYGELVCTGGFTEDGRFIRMYPVPFRKLDYEDRYKKYQWVEVDIERNKDDFRPESYRLKDTDNIKICEQIGTDNNWAKRKEIIFNNRKIYNDISELIHDAKTKDKWTSLAVFKPKKISDFKIEESEREWDKYKLDIINNQGELFEKKIMKVVKKLPYKFSYTFEDQNGKKATLMIEDWELGQLYWNCLKKHNDEKKACEDVKNKYINFMKDRDVYLFLGTTKEHHSKMARNPFIIVGVFYPKKEEPSLFSDL